MTSTRTNAAARLLDVLEIVMRSQCVKTNKIPDIVLLGFFYKEKAMNSGKQERTPLLDEHFLGHRRVDSFHIDLFEWMYRTLNSHYPYVSCHSTKCYVGLYLFDRLIARVSPQQYALKLGIDRRFVNKQTLGSDRIVDFPSWDGGRGNLLGIYVTHKESWCIQVLFDVIRGLEAIPEPV